MAKLTDFPITWDYQGHINGGSKDPGIDFGTPMNTPIQPLYSGTVIFVGEDPGSVHPTNGSKAKYVVVDSPNGHWFYVHLNRITCVVGQKLDCHNDIVGFSGDSGYTTGPHTHVGLKSRGKYIDLTSHVREAYPNPPAPPQKPEIEVLREKVTEQERTINALNTNINGFRSEIENLKVSNLQLSEQVSVISGKLETVESEKENVEKELVKIAGELDTEKILTDELLDDQLRLNTENDNLREKLATAITEEEAKKFKKSIWYTLFNIFNK